MQVWLLFLQSGVRASQTQKAYASKQIRSSFSTAAAAAAVRLTVVRFRNIIVQIDIATEK